MDFDKETIDNARKFLKETRASRQSKQEQLEEEIMKFNTDPVLETAVIARVKRYQERGAAWAMPHKMYCEKVGRKVYFMDYSFQGKDKDECVEGNPFVPKCPFAKQDTDKQACEHYNQFPFGKNKTVSIDTSKIKQKK